MYVHIQYVRTYARLPSSLICLVKKMIIGHLTTLNITKNKCTEKTIFINIQNHEKLAISSNSAQFLRWMAYLKFVEPNLRSPSTEHVKNGALSSHEQLNHNRTCGTTLYHFVWNFMGHAIRE